MGMQIKVKGPIVEGRAATIIEAAADQLAYAVAQDALAEVHRNLDQSLRNPTPYYETQITNDRRADGYVVHDRGIIYGPWLEGVSRRNAETRFKGYASFRRARQTVEARVGTTVQRVVDEIIRKLGGQ